MMKGFKKWIILAIFLTLCIHAVSAFTVSSITVDPQGSLTPSTPVTVPFKVEAGGQWVSGDDLQMFTELDNPKWTYTILVNGIESPRPVMGGRTFTISGFELSYKKGDDVSVRITLEGVAPPVTQTMDKTIIRIQEMDTKGTAIASSKVERTAKVINTKDVTDAIAAKTADLQAYRTHIDEKAALDIETSDAEAKYTEAQQKIDAAKALPSNQYTTALSNLDAAGTAISDGEKLLEKAWAEKEVAAAQIPITDVDGVIAWFKGNTSTANEPRLAPIISKREIAVSYISNANDEITNGNYAQARSKAQEAFAKGNESYNDAIDLQKQLTSSINPLAGIGKIIGSGVLIIVIGVVAVVLIVVGIIIYRKRSRWDELG